MVISLWDKNKSGTDPSDTKIVNGKYRLHFSHIYFLPPFLKAPKTFAINNKEFTLDKIDYNDKENTAVLHITVTKNPFPIALVLGVIGLGIFTFFTLTKIERVVSLPGFLIPALAGAIYMVKK